MFIHIPLFARYMCSPRLQVMMCSKPSEIPQSTKLLQVTLVTDPLESTPHDWRDQSPIHPTTRPSTDLRRHIDYSAVAPVLVHVLPPVLFDLLLVGGQHRALLLLPDILLRLDRGRPCIRATDARTRTPASDAIQDDSRQDRSNASPKPNVASSVSAHAASRKGIVPRAAHLPNHTHRVCAARHGASPHTAPRARHHGGPPVRVATSVGFRVRRGRARRRT